MNKAEIQTKVIEIAQGEDRSNADVKPESRFIEDLMFDSLDMVEFVLQCEADFDIEIPDADLEDSEANLTITTVGQAAEYVARKLGVTA